MTTPLLCATDLQRRHGETVVFAQVGLTVQAGEFVAVVGDSGVGKSTLLNALAGLERLDGGAVHLQGRRVDTLPEEAQALLRREHLGFVFQAFHVLPHLSVRQNVALPLMLLQRPDAARVQQVLDALGLGSLGERLPQQLSGGQLQRVAIARALVHRPRLILADEPTGNLDPDTAAQVMQALRQQTREQGAACVMVTHSPAAAALADRVLRLTRQGLSPEARPT
ncbi:ABC transporter ATP-binding protein [Aquabacterium lacunae]|uniref:ABC transporter ATP-binding protein n=1 Tax=Aquabacterium lacunae TaxID=2528630 RepID=A0A4Q9GV12_9BURK|nr:ABC transporter ATP-binding protein [Aquabacterium lacunae]TBO27963.1 ABC transporter ATP-binding protein [Aquabacterium lacunae]